MQISGAVLAGYVLLCGLGFSSVAAQTAQTLSIQGSAIYRVLTGDLADEVTAGFGAEGQIRFTGGALSFGLGVEYSRHEVVFAPESKVDLLGAFVEPRYVFVLGNAAAFYLSARVALSRLSAPAGEATGYALNGGGGLLFPLGSSVNLDLGVTYGAIDWGDLDTGSTTIILGTGQNAVIRAGLAIGIG